MRHIKVGDTLTLVGNWRRHTREDGMRKVKTQLQILCTSWKELGGIVGFPREVFGLLITLFCLPAMTGHDKKKKCMLS
jgi:hypothetical protein